MIFPINDEFRIRSDEHCWTVERLYVPKKGKREGEHIWEAKTYHLTLEQAVNSVYELRLRLIDAESVVDCLKAVKALHGDVTALSAQLRVAA